MTPLTLLRGDPSADAAVPPSGAAGHLTLIAAVATAFLAVLAIGAALTAGRTAERWSAAMAGAATLELPEAADPTLAARAEDVLAQTPGIASARALAAEETRALLAAWLGEDMPLSAEDLPILLAVEETPELDPAALDARLAGEFPGAIYHRHDDYGQAVARAAGRLSWMALAGLVAVIAVSLALLSLAARTALVQNRPTIETLRMIGAEDAYIARAFVRRITLRALAGAALGAILGALALAALPAAGPIPLRPGLFGWLAVLAVPLVAALVAFATTRMAAMALLRDIP